MIIAVKENVAERLMAALLLAGVLVFLAAPGWAQSSKIPNLTGKWDIRANQTKGTLHVSMQNGTRFSGTIFSEKMIDGAIVGDTVRFTRMWGSRNLRQDYTGKLTVGADGRGKITGTFTQNLKGSFPWTATSTFPIKNGSSAAASPAATKPNAAPGGALPIDVSGSWSFRGDRNQTGRVNIWQNGQHFTVISCWPKTEENLKAGIWSSYKGEGTFQGRRMVFKVLPSNREGRSADQGYVYYWTISEDNSRITGYYTRHGKRTTDKQFNYYKIK